MRMWLFGRSMAMPLGRGARGSLAIDVVMIAERAKSEHTDFIDGDSLEMMVPRKWDWVAQNMREKWFRGLCIQIVA